MQNDQHALGKRHLQASPEIQHLGVSVVGVSVAAMKASALTASLLLPTVAAFAPQRNLITRPSTVVAMGFFDSVADFFGGGGGSTQPTDVPLQKSEEEWKAALTPQQYVVLRKAGTERPWSSPFNNEKRRGTFSCAACSHKLFDADTKFESGSGWPSFFEGLEGGIMERADLSMGMLRTETLCANCGGHLGHSFPDGPRPTGIRYCMNGVSLKFEPAE